MIVKDSGLIKDEAEANGGPHTVPALGDLVAQDFCPPHPQASLIPSSRPAQWHSFPAALRSPGAQSPLYCLTHQVLVSTDKLIRSEVPRTKNSWR